MDKGYPEADLIRVVLAKLNPPQLASLYETFPPAEARRIAKKLEFDSPPTPGSWLNMAELEFSVISRQCLVLIRYAHNTEYEPFFATRILSPFHYRHTVCR